MYLTSKLFWNPQMNCILCASCWTASWLLPQTWKRLLCGASLRCMVRRTATVWRRHSVCWKRGAIWRGAIRTGVVRKLQSDNMTIWWQMFGSGIDTQELALHPEGHSTWEDGSMYRSREWIHSSGACAAGCQSWLLAKVYRLSGWVTLLFLAT